MGNSQQIQEEKKQKDPVNIQDQSVQVQAAQVQVQTQTQTQADPALMNQVQTAASSEIQQQREIERWEMVNAFRKKSGEAELVRSNYKKDFGQLDLFGLRDALNADKKSKSPLFNAMYENLNKLLELSGTNGKIVGEDGVEKTADFGQTLFAARQSTHDYLSIRLRQTHIFDNGKRRLDLAERIEHLLDELSDDINAKMQNMSEKEKRLAKYRRDKLSDAEIEARERVYEADKGAIDALKVIQTGEFGPEMDEETLKKVSDKWLAGNFSEKLMELLGNPGLLRTKEEKNDFLAALTDKNNLLLANKMTITVLIDSDRDATLGMPWVKDDLTKYVDRKLTQDDYLTLSPVEIAEKTRQIISEYAVQYSDELADCEKRQNRILELLSVDLVSGDRIKMLDDINAYPEVKDMIIHANPVEFEERLAALRQKVEADDAAVDEQLSKHYSKATITAIRHKLNTAMAGVRLFGTTENVLNQVGLYRGQLQYLAPKEFKIERMLNRLMNKYDIPRMMKDSFLETITLGAYDELEKNGFDFWKKQAEQYSQAYKANEEYFAKTVLGDSWKKKFLSFFGRKTVCVPEDKWEELEELRKKAGEYEPDKFKEEVKRVLKEGKNSTARRLSREEYLTRRKFQDEGQRKVRIQHAKREEETLEKIGNTYDDKFLLKLTSDGKDELEHYRNTDLVYLGSDEFKKLRDAEKKAASAELVQKRTEQLKTKLKDKGVAEDKLDDCVKKLGWMVEGIADTEGELHEDERLECERVNLESYGVRTWEAALTRLEKYIPTLAQGEVHSDQTAAKERYEAGILKMREYAGGRYKEIAEIFTEIPEVYTAIMSGDQGQLDSLLKNKIDTIFAQVAETLPELKEKEFHAEAIYRQYVFSNLKLLYAGTMTGNKEYHAKRIREFSQRMYKVRINDNLKKVEEALNKKYQESEAHKNDDKKKPFKPAGDEIVLTGEIKYMLMLMADNTERYEKLLDPKAAVEEALKLYETNKSRLGQEMVFSNETIDKVSIFVESDPLVDLRKKYAAQKDKGKVERSVYLNLNLEEIRDISFGKSLIRVKEKGRNAVSLDANDANTVRGELLKQIDFTLPPVLRDAIIEEGAGNGFRTTKNFVKFDQNNPMNGALYRHAHRMYELYNSLLRDTDGDPAMTEEEAQMFAVRLYGNKSDRSFFDGIMTNEKGQEAIAGIRKSEDYKEFRANYKKLVAFESEEITDPSLQREQEDMARNLRILMITNIGLKAKDSDGKVLKYADQKTDLKKAEFGRAIGESIDTHTKYIKYAASLEKVIRDQVDKYHSGKNSISVFFKDSEVLNLREYYMSEMLKALKEGKEFKESEWKEKLEKFYKERENRNALMNEKDSVSAEDLMKQEQERVETSVSEQTISNIIRNSAAFFHGRSNMYEQLDEDQKKFFAVALMLMDKGSIGQGTEGTNALLRGTQKKKKLADDIAVQLQNYVQGKEYHINIDYRDAAYKLLDYRNVWKMSLRSEYVLSKDAYEQALLFARTMYQNKQSYDNGEKDMERIRDGYASVEAAFLQDGKKQKAEIDRLSVEPMAKEDVIAKLIDYAKKDQVPVSSLLAGAAMITLGGATILVSDVLVGGNKKKVSYEKALEAAEKKKQEKTGNKDAKLTDDEIKEIKSELSVFDEALDNTISAGGMVVAAEGIKAADKSGSDFLRMSKILKRLKALEEDDEESKLFLRVMQDRTVLDISCADGSRHVDQEKRDLLFNALTGDSRIASETMSGFADNEACHQAYTNALSFQLRDDAYFKDKVISKDHFAKNALGRKSMVDWALLERAFQFIDEIKDRRATILATSHASDLIRESGNTEAISELDKLENEFGKKKEEFGRNDIENKLKNLKTVSFGYMTGGQEEIERAWSGYLGLSDQEKNLFYKVLQRRDLLDISKKDYITNFFGIADRNYLNASGRNALLNEFIQSSLGDGIGVQLDKDAYYKAMKSLLSTQVSDIVGFKGKTELDGKVKGIFSYERLGFMGRGCAIDWKLFKRALSFVKRARNELKTQEGNALLYQGAGDLAESGHIDVDYGLLRRNIHKTGNQISRAIGQIAARRVKKESGLDGILKTVNSIVGTVKDVSKIIGIGQDGVFVKTLSFIGSTVNDLRESSEKLGEPGMFTAVEVQSEDEYKESQKSEATKEKEKKEKEEKEKKRREELLFYDKIKEGFDNIVATKKGVEASIESMEAFLNQELNVYRAGQLQKKSAEKDEKNLVYKTVGGKKIKEKGDIRDLKDEIKDKKETFDDISEIVGQVPFAKNVKALLTYGIEKAIYGSIINDQILHKDITVDEDGNKVELTRSKEIEKLKKNAEIAVKEQVEKLTINIFGQDTADKLNSVEQFAYDNKKFVTDGLKYFKEGLAFAKKSVQHVQNINKCVQNIRSLERGAQDAASKRDEDKEKLKKAGEKRLNAKQLEKATQTHEMHQGLGGMSETIAKAMQKFNIAQDVINSAIETVNYAGGKISYPQQLLSGVIQDGLEMAMFAIRVCTDRKALQDYYFTTPEGLRTVNEIQNGFKLAAGEGSKTAKTNADKIEAVKKDYSLKSQLKNYNMLDILSDAQGYEHTGELVEDVGMSMAQSLVFCASRFNPMMETKLMAITVMSVMGMSKEDIGKTTSDVARKLFEAFKMSR